MGASCTSPVDEEGHSVKRIANSLSQDKANDEYAEMQRQSFAKSNRNLTGAVVPVGGEGGGVMKMSSSPTMNEDGAVVGVKKKQPPRLSLNLRGNNNEGG
jgi:hypothetical protein